ncbi:MAG: hypothetical protein AAF560_29865 [Acidobacteriota bacterium]
MQETATRKPIILTLEDVALLADGAEGLPNATKQRLRAMVLADPRFQGHLDQLEDMAEEAGITEGHDRYGAALMIHDQYQQLELNRGWLHPAEVLDPEGYLGLHYEELIHLARERAEDAGGNGRADLILRQLEAAWVDEQARREFADRVATRLLEFEPDEAALLLRRVSHEVRWRYKQLRRTAGRHATETAS